MTGGAVSLTSAEESLLMSTMIDTPDGHLGPWVRVVEQIVAARLGQTAGPSVEGEGGLRVGAMIHGFANGYFGRDSYACRVIEAEGKDWFVTRNSSGVTEFITKADAAQIHNPDDRSYCESEWSHSSCVVRTSEGDQW